MKRFFAYILLSSFCFTLWATNTVKVTIVGSALADDVKQRMESTLSNLLSTANGAMSENRDFSYAIEETDTIISSKIVRLWENCHLASLEEDIVLKYTVTSYGYQVRNIPLSLVAKSRCGKDSLIYQEAVARFDSKGALTAFSLALPEKFAISVLNSKDKRDLCNRQVILSFLEDYLTCYYLKDNQSLEKLFGGYSLEFASDWREVREHNPFEITRVANERFLKLLQIATKHSTIIASFDEVEIIRHPMNHDFYGVTIHLSWESRSYHDSGYQFLLFDSRDEQHPQIHVCTWQPDIYNKDGKGYQRIAKDEIFSLIDFDI